MSAFDGHPCNCRSNSTFIWLEFTLAGLLLSLCSLYYQIKCQGNKRNKATLAFTVLVLVQLSLVIGLLILGLKGKDETDIGNDGGVPYYTGALLVASVFVLPVVQIVAVLILTSLQEGHCISGCFLVSSCLLNLLGIVCCISGTVFVIGFGIAGCKKEESQTTQSGSGFCSYNKNNENNYTIAVVALVLILVMFVSACCSFYVFSKYSGALVSRKVAATTDNQVTPVSTPTDIDIPDIVDDSPERPNTNLLLLMQMRHLQQKNRELQRQIDVIQSGRTPRTSRKYPRSAVPRTQYRENTNLFSDLTYPSEIYSIPSPSSARDYTQTDPPPPYEPLRHSYA